MFADPLKETPPIVLGVANVAAVVAVIVPTFDRSALAISVPPAVEPSCTTIVFLVVFTVTSPRAPVKVECCTVVPLLNCTSVGIFFIL